MLNSHRPSLSRSVMLALLMLAVAGALAAALIVTGHNDGTGSANAQSAQGQAQRSAHDPSSRMGVLRRPARSDDALAPGLSRIAGNGNEFGIDASRSRRLPAPAQFGGVWAVPGSTGVCVLQSAGVATAQSCGTTEQMAAGDLIATNGGQATGLSDDQRLLFGPVPDGVPSVTVKFDDGRAAINADVNDNSLAVVIPNVDGAVEFQYGGSTVHVPFKAS